MSCILNYMSGLWMELKSLIQICSGSDTYSEFRDEKSRWQICYLARGPPGTVVERETSPQRNHLQRSLFAPRRTRSTTTRPRVPAQLHRRHRGDTRRRGRRTQGTPGLGESRTLTNTQSQYDVEMWVCPTTLDDGATETPTLGPRPSPDKPP